MNYRLTLGLLAAAVALSACVSQKTYNQEVAKAGTYQQLDAQLKGEVAAGGTLVLDAENGELTCRKK